MIYADFSGLNTLIQRVSALGRPNLTPLMVTWGLIIQADNRRGVLAGTDKNGVDMKPVAYRPVGKAERLTKAQRNTSESRKRRGEFGGFGPFNSGLHNNLTTSEYRKLDGPPLAPRREFSRVITNLGTGIIEGSPDSLIWKVTCTWMDVVSPEQVPFLPFHFDGGKNLPVRDLRGVRPRGMLEARKAAINWMRLEIRGAPQGTFNAA